MGCEIEEYKDGVLMKSDFKGTGSLVEFVESSNKVFSALDNAEVRVPDGYDGDVPRLFIDESSESKAKLVLDMQDALLFTLNNVRWTLYGGADFEVYNVYVANGVLNIEVKATVP